MDRRTVLSTVTEKVDLRDRALLVNGIRVFRTLTWRQRSLLGEAAVWLAIAWVCVKWMPFRTSSRILGRRSDGEAPRLREFDSQVAREVAWGLDVMARNLPWECFCLAQAIAGSLMFRVRRTACRSVIATRPGEANATAPEFHAWLWHGNRIVAGGGGMQGYSKLVTFNYVPAAGTKEKGVG